jgi:hypothetical protein
MLDSHLLPDEKVLWTGGPWQGLLLRPADVFMIPFSLCWGGFALMWNVTVWKGDAPIDFKLFGLPFLIIGAYVTVGRFLIDAMARRHIIYAVTNKRVLIERKFLLRTIKSLDINRLPTLELIERSDGSGTIRFGANSIFGGNGFSAWSPAFDPTPQFLRIEHVRHVYSLIDRQRD